MRLGDGRRRLAELLLGASDECPRLCATLLRTRTARGLFESAVTTTHRDLHGLIGRCLGQVFTYARCERPDP
jgi:hypothetical protein